MTRPLPGKSLSPLISYSSFKARFKCLGDASSDTPWAMSYFLPVRPDARQHRYARGFHLHRVRWALVPFPPSWSSGGQCFKCFAGAWPVPGWTEASGKGESRVRSHPLPFSHGPILPRRPRSRPLRIPGLRVGSPRLARGRAGVGRQAPAPAPRAQRAGDGGAGPGPRSRPYLPHVGRQLAPGVVVADVELHVYVHGAGSPRRRRRPGPRLERRLPPSACPGSPREARASHRRRPGQPHGRGSRRLGTARATGHRSSGDE